MDIILSMPDKEEKSNRCLGDGGRIISMKMVFLYVQKNLVDMLETEKRLARGQAVFEVNRLY
ncbi:MULTISPECIES: hypothetical protein [Megasphaera]|uniref:hypothetical protein n=1 Tax=Megasphaera TaxID=906 RepID=UPI0012B00D48|nr:MULTISPECIES: hypothetical protein [Megasphaera]MBS6138416.1 hypothetical protein [Megasphaera sp.]MCB6234117.1 hypothetical protein [Megasphaera massiliensis]MCQ5323313.1 hypothetical protein [Megasphaera massiliensis]MCQ5333629.1 hypothetical protein [Megasphaera massiliensis]